jgi:outer membrane protein
MQKYILLCLLLLFAGMSIPAGAENYTQISLQEARDLALKQNPEYQSALSALNAAKWSKTNAWAAMLPSLSFSGTLLYMDPATTVNTGSGQMTLNNDQRSMALNLSQPLFMGGKLYQAYKMAEASEKLAELSLKTESLGMISAVESKYYAVLQLLDAHQIALAEQRQAENNIELAELKQANGLISRADFLRFQAAKANKDLAALQTDTALKLALTDFNNFLNSDIPLMPSPLSLDISEAKTYSELSAGQIESFSKKAIAIAQKENLGIQSVEKSLELGERALKMAKGSFLPTVMLTGSQQYKENGIDRYKFETSNQIMLNMSVPLLPQVGNYAAMQKARYDTQKQRLEAQTATDGIALGVESAAINLIGSARQLHSAQLSLEITQDMYDQLAERFRLNMLSPMELMDAELMLSAAKMGYNNAFYNFFKARLGLLTALGTDDYNALTALIQD